MKKTLGMVCALSIMIILVTGCSSKQVIPVTNNCSKMRDAAASPSHCKLVNNKGHQYLVHESNGFSFKAPSRWGHHFTYLECDQSENGLTNYTLTVQYAPRSNDVHPCHKTNFMVLKVLNRREWDQSPKSDTVGDVLAQTDDLVYLVQLPDKKPYDLKSPPGAQFKKMQMDLDEAKANFKLLP